MDNLSYHEINYNVDRFSFVKTRKAIDLEAYRANYDLDWNEITAEYVKVGIGDIPHFASQYVFAQALHNRRTSEREEMQAMYIDIIIGIKQLIDCGDLLATI